MPYANIAVAATGATGANELVAAVSGKKIRVTSLFGMALDVVNGYFSSAADPIFGGDGTTALPFIEGRGFVLDYGPGYFTTAPGEALNLVLDADVGFVGGLTFALD